MCFFLQHFSNKLNNYWLEIKNHILKTYGTRVVDQKNLRIVPFIVQIILFYNLLLRVFALEEKKKKNYFCDVFYIATNPLYSLRSLELS